jgi:hypothetical protein
MASRVFDVKFPYSTQLTFGSLIFAAGENGELKMLLPRPAPGHLAPTSSSASGRSCAGPGCCAGSYIHTSKIIWGIPVVTSTLRPLVGASSSSTLASTSDSDSADDYLEIEASGCGEPVKDGRFIYIVARMVIGQATPPADIPQSEDQRRPMPEHRVVPWLGT